MNLQHIFLIQAYPYKGAKVLQYSGQGKYENGRMWIATDTIPRCFVRELEERLMHLAGWKCRDNHVTFMFDMNGQRYAVYLTDMDATFVSWGWAYMSGDQRLPANIKILREGG